MKLLKTLFLSFSLSLSLLLPTQNSHALVGALTGNIPLAVLGVFTMTASGSAFFYVGKENDDAQSLIFIGVLIGEILLDESNPASMTFNSLNDTDAKKLKIASNDKNVFNSEVDEARSIAQSMTKEILAKHGNNKTLTLSQASSIATTKWNQVCSQGQLSPETCRVIHAIRSQQ